MNEVKDKRGRKPLKGSPMSGTERNKRLRAKQVCLMKAAEGAGYKPYQILISDRQLRSLSKFSYLETQDVSVFDAQRVNEIVYHALKQYLHSMQQDFIKRGHSPELVEACAYQDDDFADYNNLMRIEMAAAELFKSWEESQQ